jgi:hypothetical protein
MLDILDMRGETVLAAIFAGVGGFLFGQDFRPQVDDQAMIECMSELGFEAADPSASRLEQLEQSRAWCEGFLTSAPLRTHR